MATKRLSAQVKDDTVKELMARYEYGYDEVRTHFERMERTKLAYGNKINTIQWPTISEIAIPYTFTSVEQQLPFAMKYLLPENHPFIQLNPVYKVLPMDRVRLVEAALRYTLLNKMNLEQGFYLSNKDCYRYGVGYGLIDTQVITPPGTREHILVREGTPVRRTKQMIVSGAIQIPSYEYTPVSNVIPMPGGSTPDGTTRTDHFVLKVYPEDQFRDLYNDKDENGNPYLKGNPEKIIEQARQMGFDSRLVNIEMLEILSGFNLTKTQTTAKKFPVSVPVLRYYSDHWHVWIANGTTVIWEEKDTAQTEMSDLVKLSGWPDGLEWFPMNPMEASESLSLGMNIWYNGLVDLAMYAMNPTRVVNTNMFDNPNDIPRGPKADLKVRGDARQAVAYMNLPEFSGQLFAMGSELSRLHGSSLGNPPFQDQSSPGYVRGGPNALETVMQSENGRKYLAAIMVKTGGLKPTVEKTLIKQQLLMEDGGEKFIERVINPKDKGVSWIERTVTMEDMREVYSVNIDLPEARMNSPAQFAEDMGVADRMMKMPEIFDPKSVAVECFPNRDRTLRCMHSDEVVQENTQKLIQASLQSRAAGGATEPAPMTQGEQGVMGRTAQ